MPKKHSDSLVGINGLDPLFQHKLRLGACVLLSQAESLTFNRLKQDLSATDGNLGAQMRKLEENGYVKCEKTFQERKPVTTYNLSSKGYQSLVKHLDSMKAIMNSVEK